MLETAIVLWWLALGCLGSMYGQHKLGVPVHPLFFWGAALAGPINLLAAWLVFRRKSQ